MAAGWQRWHLSPPGHSAWCIPPPPEYCTQEAILDPQGVASHRAMLLQQALYVELCHTGNLQLNTQDGRLQPSLFLLLQQHCGAVGNRHGWLSPSTLPTLGAQRPHPCFSCASGALTQTVISTIWGNCVTLAGLLSGKKQYRVGRRESDISGDWACLESKLSRTFSPASLSHRQSTWS